MPIANHPPIRRDDSPPVFHDATPQHQIADSQPLRVAPSPFSQIADSEPPFVAPSPPPQSLFEPVFNGSPPVRKTPPPYLMSIQLPDLSNIINSQLINKSPASPSKPQPPSNRRQNRNVNPSRRLEDNYLGAVGKDVSDTTPNDNYSSVDDVTIDYSYPNFGSNTPSLSTNFVYSASTPTRRTLTTLLRRPNRSSRHCSRRQRPPLPQAIDVNYRVPAANFLSSSCSSFVVAPATYWSSASTSALRRTRRHRASPPPAVRYPE